MASMTGMHAFILWEADGEFQGICHNLREKRRLPVQTNGNFFRNFRWRDHDKIYWKSRGTTAKKIDIRLRIFFSGKGHYCYDKCDVPRENDDTND